MFGFLKRLNKNTGSRDKLLKVLLDEINSLEQNVDELDSYIGETRQLIDMSRFGSLSDDYIAWAVEHQGLFRFGLPDVSSKSKNIFIKGQKIMTGLDISVDFENKSFTCNIDDRKGPILGIVQDLCDDFAEAMSLKDYYKSIYW